MDLYPRFNVIDRDLNRVGRRLSEEGARRVSMRHVWPVTVVRCERPRFKIKLATWSTPDFVILADASRPAFRGQYRSLDAACLAMDNIIRRERNMPSRIGGVAEAVERYLDAKAQREANLLEGRTAAVRPDAMVGAR